MSDLYEALGLARDATAAAIKTAYRKLAQQHHPDKGGDKAVFQRVQQAYDVLGDPERRAEYDATGKVPGQGPTLRDEAMKAVVQAVKAAIDAKDPQHDNILKLAEELLIGTGRDLKAKQAVMQKSLDKVRTAMKRTAAAKGKADSVGGMLLFLESELTVPIGQIDQARKVITAAVDILQEHEYTVDQRIDPVFTAGANAFFSTRTFTMPF